MELAAETSPPYVPSSNVSLCVRREGEERQLGQFSLAGYLQRGEQSTARLQAGSGKKLVYALGGPPLRPWGTQPAA